MMKQKKHNKQLRILAIMMISVIMTLSCFAFAFADDPEVVDPNSEDWENYSWESNYTYFYDEQTGISYWIDNNTGERVQINDETGYNQVYKPLIEYIQIYFPPVMAVIGAILSVYAILLGVKYSKAEEPQDRQKAKVAIKNAIIGLVLVFVVYAGFQILMTNVLIPQISKTARDMTTERDWETQSSTEQEYTIGIYQNSEILSIEGTKKKANNPEDYQPDVTTNDGGNSGLDMNGVGTGDQISGDGSYSQVNGDGGVSGKTTDEQIQAAVSELSTALTNYRSAETKLSNGDDDAGKLIRTSSKTLQSKYDALAKLLGDKTPSEQVEIIMKDSEAALQRAQNLMDKASAE